MLIIVDFGSQVTQLIARRVRELNVYCEIISWEKDLLTTIEEKKPKAIILSGGPESTSSAFSPTIPSKIFEMSIPIFGICYGHQLLCKLFGGKVQKSPKREFGRTLITKTTKKENPLLTGLFKKGTEQVWMSHGDAISQMPKSFISLAKSDNSDFAIIGNFEKNFFGVQFHPEVFHTKNGSKIIKNFLRIANIKPDWTSTKITEKIISDLNKKIGKEKVLCALSGGVDSCVTALLLSKAIGRNLTCIFVDNGLLRKNEPTQIIKLFEQHLKIRLITVNAKSLFLKKLKGVSDPEKKRKIIGKTFIEVFEAQSEKLKGIKYLAQGTLYPDVIESISVYGKSSHTIKSHHNVGGLPKKMSLKLVEPLRTLFKDEVRKIGGKLGLDKQFLQRHPFPGPGLAIRCPGEISNKKLNLLREVDDIFVSQLIKYNLYNKIWQALAILLPVKSVGVMGDKRTHEYTCVLRAVTSTDGMTADFFYFSKIFLSETSNRIINEIDGVNRVLFDITTKPPGTIEWE